MFYNINLVANKIKNIINIFLLCLLGLIIIIMVVLILWQVFTRFVLKIPATFTDETVRFLMIWTCLLGSSLAFGYKKHINVTILVDRMPSYLKNITQLLFYFVVIIISVFILIIGGIKIMNIAMIQKASVTQIPMGYVYSVIPISGFFTLLYVIFDIIEFISKKVGNKNV